MTARSGRTPCTAKGVCGQALLGAGLALAGTRLVLPGGAARWSRTNHRGTTVDLTSGPVLAIAAVAASGLPMPAAAAAGLGACVVGAYDDVVGVRPGQAHVKGFRGHAAALRSGRLTAGAVKVGGIAAAGLLATSLLPGRRAPLDAVLGGAVVAGAANLCNLLDLRPGRALKAGLAAAAALRLPGVGAAVAVLLPGDLAERTMLGDAGANALGAVLGLSLVQRSGRRRTGVALGVLACLTAASEVVSYSAVIEAVAPLRWTDRLGRRR